MRMRAILVKGRNAKPTKFLLQSNRQKPRLQETDFAAEALPRWQLVAGSSQCATGFLRGAVLRCVADLCALAAFGNPVNVMLVIFTGS